MKMYVKLIIYLLRKAFFRYIPTISMWLIYYYRPWREEDHRPDWWQDLLWDFESLED